MDPEKLILSFVVAPLSTAGQPRQEASRQHTKTEETERQRNQRGGGKKEREWTPRDRENRNTEGQRKDRHSKKEKRTHRESGNNETEKTEREKKTQRERETERQGDREKRETEKKRKTGGGHKCLSPPSFFFLSLILFRLLACT
jgi:hypothetical protein